MLWSNQSLIFKILCFGGHVRGKTSCHPSWAHHLTPQELAVLEDHGGVWKAFMKLIVVFAVARRPPARSNKRSLSLMWCPDWAHVWVLRFQTGWPIRYDKQNDSWVHWYRDFNCDGYQILPWRSQCCGNTSPRWPCSQNELWIWKKQVDDFVNLETIWAILSYKETEAQRKWRIWLHCKWGQCNWATEND